MPSVTIRNVPEEVHRAIRVRAAQHGRSTEAELRSILEAAARPQHRLKLGSALAAAGCKAGLTDEDFSILENLRDKAPAKTVEF